MYSHFQYDNLLHPGRKILRIKKITGLVFFPNLNISLGIIFIGDIKIRMQMGERILVIVIMNNYHIKINREICSFSSQWVKNKFN